MSVVERRLRIRRAVDALAVGETSAFVESEALAENAGDVHLLGAVIGHRPLADARALSMAARAQPDVAVRVSAENAHRIAHRTVRAPVGVIAA